MAVSKTPGGRWRGIVKQGRKTIITRTFDKKNQAEAWVRNERAKLDGLADPAAGKCRVGAALVDYLDERRSQVAQKTWQTESFLLSSWVPAPLRSRAVASVTPGDIERAMAELVAAGRAFASVKRFRDSLRAFFAWTVRQGMRSDNPLTLATLPRRTDPIREMRPWTADEFAAQCEKWEGQHPAAAEIVRFLGYTGLRWSEARALQVGDVSLLPYPSLFVQRAQPEGTSVKTTKSGKSRRVPLPTVVLDYVQRQSQGKRPTDPLLPPMHRGRLTRQLDWSATAGGRTLHDLRHTAICIWIANGIDLATVRAWAGHSDLSITSRYVHYLGSDVDRASLDKLNQGLETARGTPGVRVETQHSERSSVLRTTKTRQASA